MIQENLNAIDRKNNDRMGMDILIISTNNTDQRDYWKERLEKSRGTIIKPSAQVYSVFEDWKGGAGNGLGSLYAFKKGSELAASEGINLLDQLQSGASIAIYHTAGKGTRLAPLPASEQNNKSAVKLPSSFEVKEETFLLTMLEAVIQQTALFANSRKGRLSVFWGDQIFIPSTNCNYSSTHAVDILCKLDKTPDKNRWEQESWSNYGLLALDQEKNAKQVEKVGYETFKRLTQEKVLSTKGGVGQSLGAFSLSREMLGALLKEFSGDLEKKEGKLDSDPHFWMPLCHDLKNYLQLLDENGENRNFFTELHNRIDRVKNSLKEYSNRFLTAIDIGKDSYWWDFGTVNAYYKNNLKVLEQSDEGKALRQFYGIDESSINENGSLIIHSKIDHSAIYNSVVIGLHAACAEVNHSVLINVTTDSVKAESSVLYNVIEENSCEISTGSVRADTFIEDKQIKLESFIKLNGKSSWDQIFNGNCYSFSDVYALNEKNDSLLARKCAVEAKKSVLESI